MAIRRNSNYIVYLKKEIEIAAKQSGVDFDTAVEIIDSYFQSLREFLADPRMPYIKMGPLGHFQVTYGALKKYIQNSLNNYRIFPRKRVKIHLFEKIAFVRRIRNRILLAREGKSDGIIWWYVNPKTFHLNELKEVFKDSFDKYYTEDGKRKWS